MKRHVKRQAPVSWHPLRTMASRARAALAALVLSSLTAHGAEAARPNIVILYADDMGYGDLGVQNPESRIPTPHLDRLAAQGTRFTDAHSSSGVCTPSRYALLQGRYHWRKFHGIVNSFDPPVLDAERTTLPELLKTKGYPRNPHPGELYNLRHDLAQKHNLYAEQPDKVRDLTALLEQVRAKGQVR